MRPCLSGLLFKDVFHGLVGSNSSVCVLNTPNFILTDPTVSSTRRHRVCPLSQGSTDGLAWAKCPNDGDGYDYSTPCCTPTDVFHQPHTDKSGNCAIVYTSFPCLPPCCQSVCHWHEGNMLLLWPDIRQEIQYIQYRLLPGNERVNLESIKWALIHLRIIILRLLREL